MAPSSTLSKEEVALLEEDRETYMAIHNGTKRYTEFWSQIRQKWFQKWPAADTVYPGRDPNTLDKLEVETVRRFILSQMMKIKNWYRWRANINNRTGARAPKLDNILREALTEATVTNRTLCDWQMYSTQYYEERVKADVDAHLALLSIQTSQPVSKADRIRTVQRITKEKFAQESDEVKKIILDLVSQQHVPNEQDVEEKTKLDLRSAERAVHAIPTILERIFSWIHENSGFYLSATFVGNDPRNGKLVTGSFHYGKNQLGFDFGTAYKDFHPAVMQPYTEFVQGLINNSTLPTEIPSGSRKDDGAESSTSQPAADDVGNGLTQNRNTGYYRYHQNPMAAAQLFRSSHLFSMDDDPDPPSRSGSNDINLDTNFGLGGGPFGAWDDVSNVTGGSKAGDTGYLSSGVSDMEGSEYGSESDMNMLIDSDDNGVRSSLHINPAPLFDVNPITTSGPLVTPLCFTTEVEHARRFQPIIPPNFIVPATPIATPTATTTNTVPTTPTATPTTTTTNTVPPSAATAPPFLGHNLLEQLDAVSIQISAPTIDASSTSIPINPDKSDQSGSASTASTVPTTLPIPSPSPSLPSSSPLSNIDNQADKPIDPHLNSLENDLGHNMAETSGSSELNIARRSSRTTIPSKRADELNAIGSNVLIPKTKTPSSLDITQNTWVDGLKESLMALEGGSDWIECVEKWAQFELDAHYATAKGYLPSVELRPAEWAQWTLSGRCLDKPPLIDEPADFGIALTKWWYNIQPAFRRIEDHTPRKLYTDLTGESTAPWIPLRRGGPNGISSIIIMLSWWGRAISSSSVWREDSSSSWKELVVDVTLAIDGMVSEAVNIPSAGKGVKRKVAGSTSVSKRGRRGPA